MKNKHCIAQIDIKHLKKVCPIHQICSEDNKWYYLTHICQLSKPLFLSLVQKKQKRKKATKHIKFIDVLLNGINLSNQLWIKLS